MSSILTPQGIVVATAMAVSGTFILLALRLQKNLPVTYLSGHLSPLPRSCISSSEGKKGEKKKKKVHFADDVVDPSGKSQDFHKCNYQNTPDLISISPLSEIRGMPANRAALYQGMLKNRMVHPRFAYSY